MKCLLTLLLSSLMTFSVFAQEKDTVDRQIGFLNFYAQNYDFADLNRVFTENRFPELDEWSFEMEIGRKNYSGKSNWMSRQAFFFNFHDLDDEYVIRTDDNVVTRSSVNMTSLGFSSGSGGYYQFGKGWRLEALVDFDFVLSLLRTYHNIPPSVGFNNIITTEVEKHAFWRFAILFTPRIELTKSFFDDGLQLGIMARYRWDPFTPDWQYRGDFTVNNVPDSRLNGFGVGITVGFGKKLNLEDK